MDNMKYLKELVSIKSFDTNENKEIVSYLEKEFSKNSKEVIKVKNVKNGKENLLVGINCNLKNAKDAIVLAGHMDTVVADEKAYLTNPYKVVEKDGKIYGLGTIDMKSFFAIILNKIKELSSLKMPIVVAISSDEETEFDGVEQISNKMEELGIIPKFSIIGEPTNSNICSESNSCYEFEINIVGKSCHSSNPNAGVNANYILAKLLNLVEKLNDKFCGTTISSNLISGGEKVNIISDKAKMVFDVRTNDNGKCKKLLKIINNEIKKLENKYAGAKIEMKNTLKILPLEYKNPKLIQNLCKKFELENNKFIGGCEAGYYQQLGGDAVVFGVGDLALAHKPNEFAVISEFEKYQELLIQVIKEFE